MYRTALISVFALLLASVSDSPTPAQPPADHAKKFPDFADVVRGARELDGLFRLYQKDDHVFAEIRPDQFDRPLLAPVAIARGLARAGETRNFDEQWVLSFRRVGDKVHLVRRNVHYRASHHDAPVALAVEAGFTDSVLVALPIKAVNPGRGSVLVDLNDVFLTDFAQLGLGSFDRDRSAWHKVKAFPRNIELEVTATYSGRGAEGVIDSRGVTVVVHYGLVELPDGYQPRLADDRVGHFVTAVKDYTAEGQDAPFVRYVNRWRLERADGLANVPPGQHVKLSPPKKKIVFWIEKSVPDEYRAFVREGILEWNKAFEKIGFRDAIEVRQQESEEFDPEDITYSTFRWITSNEAYAIGPSRVNPLTGEILDADILFDADMIRAWKRDRQIWGGQAGAEGPVSLIQATREGWAFADRLGWDDRAGLSREEKRARFAALRQSACQCGPCLRYEMDLAGLALAGRGLVKTGDRLPDELIGQAVKMVVMHEVGHTLGLRHNFKASAMLPNEQLHDTAVTHAKGLVGSVMDYTPINLAPKGTKQGDYFTTTLGPYDYWAIDYAYRPLSGGPDGESAELRKLAAKCAGPGLDYGTDEDLASPDPLTNVWDLGADPLRFAQDRMALAEELLPGLAERVVEPGEGYQRARQAFNLVLRQYGDGAYLVAQHVGGAYVHRDHRGDPAGRDPYVPVSPAKQREALKFLQDHILTDKPFKFSPELLRRLASERWSHWGADPAGADYPLPERVLQVQRLVLEQLLDPAALRRVQGNSLRVSPGEQPLTLAEVFRALSDSVWCDLPAAPGGKPACPATLVRRNLQREHLKELARLVLGRPAPPRNLFVLIFGDRDTQTAPADARSLARLHLRELAKRIDAALADKSVTSDDLTRAHLEECKEQIARAMAASVQATE